MTPKEDHHGPLYWLLSVLGLAALLGVSLYARLWVVAALFGLALSGALEGWLGLVWRERLSKTQRFAVDFLILLMLMGIVIAAAGRQRIETVLIAAVLTVGWLSWRTRRLNKEK